MNLYIRLRSFVSKIKKEQIDLDERKGTNKKNLQDNFFNHNNCYSKYHGNYNISAMNEHNPFEINHGKQQMRFEEIVGLKHTENSPNSHSHKQSRSGQSSANPFKINQNPEPMFVNSRFSNVYRHSHNLFYHSSAAHSSLKYRYSKNTEMSIPELKGLNRSESKIGTLAYEQSIKKFKQILSQHYSKNIFASSSPYRNTTNSDEKKMYKATRLVFYKDQRSGRSQGYKKNEKNYVVLRLQKKIIVYQLYQPNINNIKPYQIEIEESNISNSIEFDFEDQRIFYFCNTTQNLIVFSIKFKEVICRVPIRKRRINPILYLFKIQESLYLLVIGGYFNHTADLVEGSSFVEIFEITKWSLSLNPVILKINIGRIQPIVFPDFGDQPGVYIIAGHSTSVVRQRKLNLHYKSDINFSTNKTGVKLTSQIIEQCFLNRDFAKNAFIVNNVNVQFNKPLSLFGGCVLFRKVGKHEKLELFLIGCREIYEIKIVKDDLYIINTSLYLTQAKKSQFHRRMNYHRDSNNQYSLYEVDNQGKLKAVQQRWKQDNLHPYPKQLNVTANSQHHPQQKKNKCHIM